MQRSIWRSSLILGAFLSCLGVAACGSDSASTEPPSGGNGGQDQDAAAGSGGTAGQAGASGTAGASGKGGTAGTAGDAGTGGAAGNAGGAGTGGTAGNAGGAGTGGTAGTAGSAGTGGTAGNAGSAGTGGSAGDGGTCVDKCTENNAQCVGVQLQTCVKQTSGCTDWNAPADCPNGKACNAGACPSCTDKCTFGNTQCSGAQIQQCTTQSNGCTDWGTPTDCPYSKACNAGTCPVCVDKCLVNQTQCNGVQVQTCLTQSNGCTDWEAPVNCGNGKACTQGACPTCTDQCTLTLTQCNGTQIQACTTQTNGCAGWDLPANCPNNKSCVNGVCPTCTDQCTGGDTKCSGAKVQTCSLQSSGCLDWSTADDCPGGGICQGTACVSACNANDLRCNGTLLEVCNSSHQWMTQQVCTQSCDPQTKACVVSATCTAASRRCVGLQSQVCNSTGTAWLNVESCLVACDQGLCTGASTPNATRCNGMTPETCNSTGTAWTSGTACTTYCYKGACAEPSLTIDANANAKLEGEHVYQGDVVIKNSSVLTVSTGKLIIRAKNVILDSTSNIVVTPTGDDPRGKGVDGGSASCQAYCSYYGTYLTGSGTVGGGGGGYGVAGGTASVTFSPYCYYSTSCVASHSGGAVFGIADDELATGSAGGSCSPNNGGKGGGYLAIYAETITIQGTITANGQSATGCAAGGSGGEVLLRGTKDVAFTGSISVAGGLGGGLNAAGNGGNGVVKLLYGDAKTTTGSVIGTQFASYMPPNDLTSSTHPRPDLWYNDGYTSFDLAWSKPFTASAGYYRKLNTTYGFVPSPSNANYQSGEALSYVPTDLVVGTNYLHVATLGPFANMGTVESRFVVNVNSTPPTVSSTSHPTQSSWYANDSPYMTWTLPKADNNTTNFYWVFDRFKETIPTVSDNKIPMDLGNPQNSKQILLPNKANGIWFFHLITQDTMTYLTKAAALFEVNIGNDPGKGSVSGTVLEGTTQLSGATISLNRGVLNATTNGTGAYAFTGTVYAQDYEIRARLTGYFDATQTVTVVAGQTSTVNFQMVHK